MRDKLTLLVAALVVMASVFLYYHFADLAQVGRVGIVLVAFVIAGFVAYSCDAGKSAWQFAKGANVERQKVVWPNRREAMMVTVMVFVLVILIGIFIALVDAGLFALIYDFILGVSK